MRSIKKAIQFLTIDLSPELGNKIQELNQEKNEMTIMDMKHKQTVDLSDTLEFITLCIISSYLEYYDWPYCSVVPDSYLISLFCQCYSPCGGAANY